MKKHIYRIGDRVRVVNPRWIKRVGYSLVWTDLIDEVKADPRTVAAWQVIISGPGADPSREFVRAVAMQRVEQRGFGGNERRIHYEPIPEAQVPGCIHYGFARGPGQVLTVSAKRTAYTGVRFGPSGYDEDYNDGGLDDRKAHVLLTVESGIIEACDVEPVL